MDDSVKSVLKDMIEVEQACSEYLRIFQEKQEPFKRVYSTYDTHEIDLNSFSELMFNKIRILEERNNKYVSFSLHHLVRYLDNIPDSDDPELIKIIKWVNESYTKYIIDMVSQCVMKE